MTRADSIQSASAHQIFLDGRDLRSQIGRLRLHSKRGITGDVIGQYRTAFRGQGLLFSDLKEYEPGDDIKLIQWSASSRTGKIFVKSFEEERDLKIIICLDISRSVNFGSSRTNFQKALEFAALVTVLAEQSRDAVGLCLFSDTVHQYLEPVRSRFAFHRMIDALSADRPFAPKTDISRALGWLSAHAPRRSLIFVLSDFLSKPFFTPLNALSRRHDVVLVGLVDPIELELPTAGLLEIEDAETHRTLTIDTSDPAAARALRRFHMKRFAAVGAAASGGFDDPGTDSV